MKKSKLFSLNFRDFARGITVAILAAVLQLLQVVLLDPSLYSFKAVAVRCGWTALAAIVGYLVLNLSTNSTGEILTKDN
jgi:hypothetical protein